MGSNPVSSVLVIEDTVSLSMLYSGYLSTVGYTAVIAETGEQAVQLISNKGFDAILLDLGLPDVDGMKLLEQIRSRKDHPPIIVITADASIQTAVNAVRAGAYEYLVKPVARDRLLDTIGCAITSRKNDIVNTSDQTQSASQMPDRLSVHESTQFDENTGRSFCGFDGASNVMRKVYDRIASVASSKAAVFITGESGTGKELCAEAVHESSPNCSGPFVAINCGAIPHDLIESEIFGHVKGSFTGALHDRAGAARSAHGGTLFLDEICEMDFGLQTKLLRFLQTGKIQPVGSSESIKLDVRIICATNKDPLIEVQKGNFREDLYFRLYVLPIDLPPLRLRGDDILAMANLFLEQYTKEEGKPLMRFSETAAVALSRHAWPGNVRELQNVIRRAVVLNNTGVIDEAMLALSTHGLQGMNAINEDVAYQQIELDIAGLREISTKHGPGRQPGRTLMQIEKDAIEDTIMACKGSIPKAAKILGVSPSTIYRKREAWLAAL